MKLFFITHDNHNAEFNLASEEYLLKQTEDFFVYLWINAPAVIVGTNQNALEEVNLSYTKEHGIKVVRRLTGGGAVYHDHGNLCYTVIAPYDSTEETYKKFTAPVIEYLNSLGVKADFSGRNDITIDGKKISGNAQTIYKDRIMHHGTILFNTDASVLAGALNPNKLKMQSKGIKSVRSRVTNVIEHLPKKMDIDEFKRGLEKKFLKDCIRYNFTKKDILEIEKLIAEKYSRYEWNIGRSPKGQNSFERKFDFGVMKITFDTEQGAVKNAQITGDFFSKKPIAEFSEKLDGVRFEKTALLNVFSSIGDYVSGANGKEIVNALFE